MIRWREVDEIKLRVAVRKFNASITRLSKKNPEIAEAGLYPEKLNIEHIRRNISTRKDFNRVIARVERWFKPGNKDIVTTKAGIKTTKWELKEARYAQQRINYQRKKIRQGFNVSQKTLEESQLADVSVNDKLKSIKVRLDKGLDIENENQSWKNFVHQLFIMESENYNNKKAEQYYDNYKAALYENFGITNASAIANMLDELGIDGKQLFALSLLDERLSIGFIYSPEEEEELVDFLLSTIPTLYKEMVDKGVFNS